MSRRPTYTAVVLGALAGASGFGIYVLLALASDVGASLGDTPKSIASLALTQSLLVVVAILAIAAGVHRRGRLVIAASAAAGVATATCALLAVGTTPWALTFLLAANSLGAAGVLALHSPLLAAVAEGGGRVRAFALHRAVQAATAGIGAGLVAALATDGGLTWRGVLIVLAGLALLSLLCAAFLREPAPSAGTRPAASAELRLGLSEIARGVARAPTVARLLAANAALGVVTVPLVLFVLLFLEDRWDLRLASRGIVLATTALATSAVLALLAAEGERLLERGPAALLRPAANILGLAAAALVAALAVPAFGLAVALLCVAFAGMALAQAAMNLVLMEIVEPAARVPAAALAGMASAGVGGVLGLLVTVGVAQDVGVQGALTALAIPALGGAMAMRGAADTAEQDVAATAARLAEEAGVQAARAAGRTAPLLSAHGILVRYGHRRAVDGVDLEIAQGELLALLGTNGAGKSTLLRVLSGITPPDAGSVRLDGRDITLLDPERRGNLGIGHVAFGAAVFDTLRVDEALRLAAHSLGLRGPEATDAVDWALAQFPRLDERRASRGAALSGGERQMLALAQMLLRRPRLLLADELSIGLAPGIVENLLQVVRDAHSQGTTVVVVEQSVDLALELATRAIFLERGRVRFDGPPDDLRSRDDLLRPVFLGRGAAGRPAPATGG
jgi:ABC-type branched-subunit amino acid transport system ATPase component/MFS family permease